MWDYSVWKLTYIFSFILGSIQMRQAGQGVALLAPTHGLQEVFFGDDELRVMQ